MRQHQRADFGTACHFGDVGMGAAALPELLARLAPRREMHHVNENVGLTRERDHRVTDPAAVARIAKRGGIAVDAIAVALQKRLHVPTFSDSRAPAMALDLVARTDL